MTEMLDGPMALAMGGAGLLLLLLAAVLVLSIFALVKYLRGA